MEEPGDAAAECTVERHEPPTRRVTTPPIEHVVVLMLENRSFDHLLGSLDPGGPTRVENRFELDNPSAGSVSAWPATSYGLAVDPPHSHAGVMEQINGTGTRAMNGFVAAYLKKIKGKEKSRVFRKGPIAGAVLTVWAMMVLIACLPVDPRIWAPTMFAVLALAVVTLLRLAKAHMDYPTWSRWTNKGLAAVLVLTVTTAITSAFDPAWRPLPPLGLIAIVALYFVGKRVIAKLRNRARDPEQLAARAVAYLEPDMAPVLHKLASEFAVCTRWFSSVPGETWPNRNFLHAGTSGGATGIEAGFFDDTTVFELFEDLRNAGDTDPDEEMWRIYFNGLPQVWFYKNLWATDDMISHWYSFDPVPGQIGFEEAAQLGKLPAYTFIEPRHMSGFTNSQHPGNNTGSEAGAWDFQRGEQLIARIYEALRSNKTEFEKTLFIITYDEHGGLSDHEPPPTDWPAPSFEPPHWTRRFVKKFMSPPLDDFDFTTLGVRVPAVLVSPWIAPGTVCDEEYDHTAIISTLRSLFGLGELKERDAESPSLWPPCATAGEPRTSDLPDLGEYAAAPLTPDITAPGIPSSRPPQGEIEEQLAGLAATVDRLLEEPDEIGLLATLQGHPLIASDPAGPLLAKFLAAAIRARGDADEPLQT